MALRFAVAVVVAQGALAQDYKKLFKNDDGIIPEFFSEVVMKSAFETALFRDKGNFEDTGRRLQTFQDNHKRRRLQSTTDVMSGQEGNNLSGPHSAPVQESAGQAACSMPEKTMSCVTVKPPDAMCEMMAGLGEMQKSSTTAEPCICTDCPEAGKLMDAQLTFAADASVPGKLTEKDMQAKGLDEIVTMCKYKAPIECIFGGTKPNCKSMIADMEKNLPTTAGEPTPTQGVNDYLIPALKCVCDDCKYEKFANAMKPHAKELMNTQDMFPVMKKMAGTFCANVGTVKCLMSLQGDCKPKGMDITPEIEKMKSLAHGGLDCMCTKCPAIMGKVLTLSEKQSKGEFTDQKQAVAAICDMYPDAQCLMQQSDCKDAVKFVFAESQKGNMGAAQGTQDFDKWATDNLAQLKSQCEQSGITVKEYTAGGDAAGAIRTQRGPLAMILAAVVAVFAQFA